MVLDRLVVLRFLEIWSFSDIGNSRARAHTHSTHSRHTATDQQNILCVVFVWISCSIISLFFFFSSKFYYYFSLPFISFTLYKWKLANKQTKLWIIIIITIIVCKRAQCALAHAKYYGLDAKRFHFRVFLFSFFLLFFFPSLRFSYFVILFFFYAGFGVSQFMLMDFMFIYWSLRLAKLLWFELNGIKKQIAVGASAIIIDAIWNFRRIDSKIRNDRLPSV